MIDEKTSMLGKLLHCRLCARITMAAMVAIVIIEAIVLIPAYRNYEGDLLSRLEATGLATIIGAFTLNGHYTGHDLLILAKVLSKRTQVVGGRMYQSDGSLIGTFGESSEMTLAEADSKGANKVRRADGNRYEVLWPAGTGGLRFAMTVRLDSSWVQPKLNEFVFQSVGLVLLLSAFVTLAIMVILNKLVLSPLLLLRERMVATAADPGDPVHHILPEGRKDELGEVTAAFNKMLDRLSLNFRRLKDNERYLRETKEMAEISDRAKSAFLANMSHELRTPLNAIIGFSSTIIEQIFGPMENGKYREYIGNIHDSGEHLLELINDILDVSVIEAGKLELNDDTMTLKKVAESTVRLVRWRAEQNKVHLINDIGDDLPEFVGDERRMKQILSNLLTNAIKFTPKDGTVTMDAWIETDGALVISVSDTGVGMDEKALAKALTPFGHQDCDLDSDVARKDYGIGLGLPLTMGLIKAHGGTMNIQSAPNAGTIVTVRLPSERIKGVPALQSAI